MIPTKDNLSRCGVVYSGSFCFGGYGKEKSINHLFLKYDFFGSIWTHVLHWLGISHVLPADICTDAMKFGGSRFLIKDICHYF